MPTRIYLVRHGATQLTAEDRFAGSWDVTLSAEGQRQVASLAERLKKDKLDAIYRVPLRARLKPRVSSHRRMVFNQCRSPVSGRSITGVGKG